MISENDLKQINKQPIVDAIRKLTEIFPNQVVFSSSLGQEDQVLTDIINQNKLDVRIFTLDTGRLFYEHYDLLAKNNVKYSNKIQVFFPNSKDVEDYVNQNGVNAFYNSVELRKDCCNIRKVKPLERALKDAKVWITGLRADQSENRHGLNKIEFDQQKQLYKYNPLLDWSYQQVIDYIKKHQVQDMPLHQQGYISIGCKPCTRAISEGEHPRDGRWWWENSHKECGLHAPNKN